MTPTKTMDTMTDLRATPVIKDKFWIVEDGDQKVATIQAIEDGTVVYVSDHGREKFATVNLLKTKLNISFNRATKKRAAAPAHEVHGWPCAHRPYNPLWDVAKRIPIYTKTEKSRSYFCAGYYLIKFANNWVKAYCPKLITLQRYEFLGPFSSADQQQTELRKSNGTT